MPVEQRLEGYWTIHEIASYGHVTRQAVYLAIHKGLCKGFKYQGCWMLRKEDYDDYRANRHNKDLRKRDGKPLYDLEKGTYSVRQVSTIMSATLGRPYPMQRIYHKMRTGQLPAYRSGPAWIIYKKDAVELLERELEAQRKGWK